MNSAASLPSSAAMRSCSALTLGSSPKTSSPSGAANIASRMRGGGARDGVAAQVDHDRGHQLHRRLRFEEVAQHRVAVLGQDGLRMELHALERRARAGQLAVAHAHDLAVLRARRDDQLGRAGLALDRQRVVADHAELARQAGVDALAVGGQRAGLAVHLALRAHDAAAERRADALVAQAHAQDRQLADVGLDRRHAHAGLGGRAGPGRQHQVIGLQRADLLDADLVVAHDPHVLSELAEVLHEVEREGIVVVDHQKHERSWVWL